MSKNVFIGIPSSDNKIVEGTMSAMIAASNHGAVKCSVAAHKCREFAMNSIWNEALNSQKEYKITHFAMMDDNICPSPMWLPDMLRIMKETNADVVSVVVPELNPSGITHFAMDEKTEKDPYLVQRLTLNQLHSLEKVFTDPRLLVTTSLMLVDFTKPWVKDMVFESRHYRGVHNGQSYADMETIDWNFSRKVKAAGGTLFGSTSILVKVMGSAAYFNGTPWGTISADPLWHDEKNENKNS